MWCKIGIWFLRLPCFTLIFVQFPPSDIPYNLYHRETFLSNTEKSGVKATQKLPVFGNAIISGFIIG